MGRMDREQKPEQATTHRRGGGGAWCWLRAVQALMTVLVAVVFRMTM